MTDVVIQQKLIAAFLTLNDASGVPYIKFNGLEPANAALPNKPFTPPSSKQFFSIAFLPNEPEPAAMGTEAENRWNGILQIDICTPLGKGEDEANAKYNALAKLFARGKYFGEVLIQRVYRAQTRVDIDIFVTVIRVEWAANLER
jgi:hypothetical protein